MVRETESEPRTFEDGECEGGLKTTPCGEPRVFHGDVVTVKKEGRLEKAARSKATDWVMMQDGHHVWVPSSIC